MPMLTENHLRNTLASPKSAVVNICQVGKVEDATAAEGVVGKGRLRVERLMDVNAVTANL